MIRIEDVPPDVLKEVAYWFGGQNRRARASDCHVVNGWISDREPSETLDDFMSAAGAEFPADLREDR